MSSMASIVNRVTVAGSTGFRNRLGVGLVKAFAVVICACALLAPRASMCQTPGERGDHTATMLSYGVLLAGGNDNLGRVASTHLYLPAANEWSTVGSLITPRFLHTATPLPSGRVLVAGGTNGSILNEVEIYDPLTFTWSAAAPMNIARYGHAATLLDDGRILVIGGLTAGGATATCELYDPATGKWSLAPSMRTARSGHTAVQPWSGGPRVLVAGGENESGALASVEIYDASANAWTPAADMAHARSAHAATSLPYGVVLVSGGDAGNVLLDSAERFSFASGVWTPAGALPSPRKLHTMTLRLEKSLYWAEWMGGSQGTVLAAGGFDGSGAVASSSLYSAATNSWAAAGNLGVARWGHSAVAAGPLGVLVMGGFNPTDGYLASAEVFYGSWSKWGYFPRDVAGLMAPVGNVTTAAPTYRWNAVPGAVSYALWVADQPAGTSDLYASYTAAQAGCPTGGGVCEVAPATALDTGQSYRWAVRTTGGASDGVWSAPALFFVDDPRALPPAAKGLKSPSGYTTNATPTYTWGNVPAASSYTLWVGDAGTGVVYETYTTAQAGCQRGGLNACSVTPAMRLPTGRTYTWGVLTANKLGYGPWSTANVFFVASPPPPAPTNISPIGTVSTTTPTYSWDAAAGAQWYNLHVSLTPTAIIAPTNVVHATYSAAAAGCASGTGRCSVAPATALLRGTSYNWSVRGFLDGAPGGGATTTPDAYGPWTSGTFVVAN